MWPMAKRKRNKDKFWCPDCRKVGYRNEEQARATASLAASPKVVFACAQGYGWHFGPFEPGEGGDPA
jgi:hypothetical protein